jgi:hypothetical protein
LFPDDLFYRILKKSCYKNSFPETIGNIESYEYWPHWDAANVTRTNYIEPDLFLRFDKFDLIVEAKRWDHNQQYLTQWKNEFIGYRNEYKEDKKDVFLLAIGGINNEDEENINVENYGSINVIKCRWNRVLEVLIEILSEIDRCYYINNNDLKRIALIIISALKLHGYIKIDWLDDLVDKYRIDYDNSLSALNNWRGKDGWI